MSVATIEEAVVEKLRLLPREKQQQALEFVEFLEQKTAPKLAKTLLSSSYGLCADLNISIGKEEIDEARREMWANFPREKFFDTEDKQ